MSIQKLVRSVIFSLAIITFLVNLINISYSVNYYARYNENNIKIITDFNSLHLEKNTESEYNELCSKIQPANFIEVYDGLSKWSREMIKILAITTLGYLIYLFVYLFINIEKRSEKVGFKNIGIILLLSFFISCVFYFFSLDTEYDIIYCLQSLIQ